MLDKNDKYINLYREAAVLSRWCINIYYMWCNKILEVQQSENIYLVDFVPALTFTLTCNLNNLFHHQNPLAKQ